LPAALLIILPSYHLGNLGHRDFGILMSGIKFGEVFTIFLAFQPYEKILVNSPSKKGHNESETCKFIRTSTMKVNIFDRGTKKLTRKSDPYPEV
jgi:hypothetical protein